MNQIKSARLYLEDVERRYEKYKLSGTLFNHMLENAIIPVTIKTLKGGYESN